MYRTTKWKPWEDDILIKTGAVAGRTRGACRQRRFKIAYIRICNGEDAAKVCKDLEVNVLDIVMIERQCMKRDRIKRPPFVQQYIDNAQECWSR